MIHALSKYIEVECVKSTSVSETVDALSSIFARQGLPDVLVSDNAPCFTAYDFEAFFSRNGIKHTTPPPPYYPSSNGQAERGVRVIKDALKKSSHTGSLQYRLSKILLEYRCTPHSTTQIEPSIALNNRKLVTAKDRLNPNYCFPCSDNVTKKKCIPQFDIGSSVLALNMRDGEKWLHATVADKIGVNIYNVHVHDLNVIWKRHANQLLRIPNES